MQRPSLIRMLASAGAVIFGFALASMLIYQYGFPVAAPSPFIVGVADIGTQMLSVTEHGYILPFEAVSLLLLAAMIGCIVIALKTPAIVEVKEEVKQQITLQP